MTFELSGFCTDFAAALAEVDATRPVASNARTGVCFQAGIGPHSESETCRLVLNRMKANSSDYDDLVTSVPYGTGLRTKCDLASADWAIEAKMLRLFGDNGRPNDNLLMHILSPYEQHRSALTDCEKLRAGRPRRRLGVMIYAYDHSEWPMELAIEAFETLASSRFRLSARNRADFGGLIHPVHKDGAVFAWELSG